MGTKKINITICPKAAERLENIKNVSRYINNLILNHSESTVEKDIKEIKEMLAMLSQGRPVLREPADKMSAQTPGKPGPGVNNNRKELLTSMFGTLGLKS